MNSSYSAFSSSEREERKNKTDCANNDIMRCALKKKNWIKIYTYTIHTACIGSATLV